MRLKHRLVVIEVLIVIMTTVVLLLSALLPVVAVIEKCGLGIVLTMLAICVFAFLMLAPSYKCRIANIRFYLSDRFDELVGKGGNYVQDT